MRPPRVAVAATGIEGEADPLMLWLPEQGLPTVVAVSVRAATLAAIVFGQSLL